MSDLLVWEEPMNPDLELLSLLHVRSNLWNSHVTARTQVHTASCLRTLISQAVLNAQI